MELVSRRLKVKKLSKGYAVQQNNTRQDNQRNEMQYDEQND